MNSLYIHISISLVFLVIGSNCCAQVDENCLVKLKDKTKSVLNLKTDNDKVTFMKMTTIATSGDESIPEASETVEYLFNDKTMIMTSTHADMIADDKNVYSIFHDDRTIFRSSPSPEELDLKKMANAGRDSIFDTGTIEGCDCVLNNFKNCTISITPSEEWSEQLKVNKIEMSFNTQGEFYGYVYYFKKGAQYKTVEITIDEMMVNYPFKGDFTAQGYITQNAKKYESYERK